MYDRERAFFQRELAEHKGFCIMRLVDLLISISRNLVLTNHKGLYSPHDPHSGLKTYCTIPGSKPIKMWDVSKHFKAWNVMLNVNI